MRPFRSALLVSILAEAALAFALSSAALSNPAFAASTPAPLTSSPFLTGSTSYPFTYTQADGTKAVVKSPPTRVMTVDLPVFAMDELEALGVNPIGGETVNFSQLNVGRGEYDSRGIPLEDSSQIKSFINVGSTGAPDLEKVATLQPDLIVGYAGTATGDFVQLKAIAPIENVNLTAPPTGTGIERLPWYPELRLLAQILNRRTQFNAFISKFEAAAAKYRPEFTGKSVSLVVPLNSGEETEVFGPNYYSGTVLSYLGFTVPPFPNGTSSKEEVSLERAGELNGRYLMIAAFAPGVAATFLSNPVVKQLASVKAGRVVETGSATPYHGFPSNGPISQLLAIPMLGQAFK